MELGFKVFVLLAFAFNLALCDFDCSANTFKNNPFLKTKLSGWLYTVYTSEVFGINEIFNCDVDLRNQNTLCRTTTDNQCCRSFNVATTPQQDDIRNPTSPYFKYLIESAPDCPKQLKEYAHLKLLAGRLGYDGSYCLILWTCRSSREGLHAFCSKQTVSNDQKTWIERKFAEQSRTAVKVTQVEDYRNGKCFPSSVPTGWDNIFKQQT